MPHQRRSFGSIERRASLPDSLCGPDGRRYDAPDSFLTRLEAEHWLAEVHREIASGDWRPRRRRTTRGPNSTSCPDSPAATSPNATSIPRTREEYTKLLEGLVLPTLGEVQLRCLEPDQIRRWYSTVLSDHQPTQPKHAYSLLRSILRDVEDEGLIERNPCRTLNTSRLRRTRDIELLIG